MPSFNSPDRRQRWSCAKMIDSAETSIKPTIVQSTGATCAVMSSVISRHLLPKGHKQLWCQLHLRRRRDMPGATPQCPGCVAAYFFLQQNAAGMVCTSVFNAIAPAKYPERRHETLHRRRSGRGRRHVACGCDALRRMTKHRVEARYPRCPARKAGRRLRTEQRGRRNNEEA